MISALALSFSLALAAGSGSGLDPLLIDGPALHPTLTTHDIGAGPVRHVRGNVVTENPEVSTDPEFVNAIAHSGSQGKLGGDGVRSALYAVYDGEDQLGFYGLETESTGDDDRFETALRGIWSHNASINRARVHRAGNVIVVVWTGGVALETWEAVNATVDERLRAP